MAVKIRGGAAYTRPVRRRPSALGPAGPGVVVAIRGMEVVQCVQDFANSVPLIADKVTFAPSAPSSSSCQNTHPT